MPWSNVYSVVRNLYKLAALSRSHSIWGSTRREDGNRRWRMNTNLTHHLARKFYVSHRRYRNAFCQKNSMLVCTAEFVMYCYQKRLSRLSMAFCHRGTGWAPHVCFFVKVSQIYGSRHMLYTFTALYKSIQPFTVWSMIKWVLALWTVNINKWWWRACEGQSFKFYRY